MDTSIGVDKTDSVTNRETNPVRGDSEKGQRIGQVRVREVTLLEKPLISHVGIAVKDLKKAIETYSVLTGDLV